MLAPRYTLHFPSPRQRPRPSVHHPLPLRFRNESSSRTNSLGTTRTRNRFFMAAVVRLRSDGPSRRNSSYRPNYRDLPSATNKSHPRSLSLASCARGSTRRHRVHQTSNYQREIAFSEQRVVRTNFRWIGVGDDETVDRKACNWRETALDTR